MNDKKKYVKRNSERQRQRERDRERDRQSDCNEIQLGRQDSHDKIISLLLITVRALLPSTRTHTPTQAGGETKPLCGNLPLGERDWQLYKTKEKLKHKEYKQKHHQKST